MATMAAVLGIHQMAAMADLATMNQDLKIGTYSADLSSS